MYNPEFIKIINSAAAEFGIKASRLDGSRVIILQKNTDIKYIIGYTLPINNSTSYKIANTKNLCSDILRLNGIPNIPHILLLNPKILLKRNNNDGNKQLFQDFISKNGYPFVLKKNNSSNGEGVYLIRNATELESTLTQVYLSDNTLVLSPYRHIISEYRNIVLNETCLLSYEKQIPFVTGNGNNTIIELLSEFIKDPTNDISKSEKIIHEYLIGDLMKVPQMGQRIYLQWKHNSINGAKNKVVKNEIIESMAIKAAQAIASKFCSVDITFSKDYGFEVLEINATVVLNDFSISSKDNYNKTVNIFKLALNELFPTNSRPEII